MASFTSPDGLAELGRSHIVAGKITYSSGVPSISSNDADASVADTGTGNCIVTWGVVWGAAPIVVCSALKGTHSATTHNNVLAEAASTTVVEFRWLEHVDASASTSPDPADDEEIHFVAVGIATALT